MNRPEGQIHRAFRIADMLWRFDKGNRMTMEEMSRRYRVSRRTIQRDLAGIEQYLRLPIDSCRGFDMSASERNYGFWRDQS